MPKADAIFTIGNSKEQLSAESGYVYLRLLHNYI